MLGRPVHSHSRFELTACPGQWGEMGIPRTECRTWVRLGSEPVQAETRPLWTGLLAEGWMTDSSTRVTNQPSTVPQLHCIADRQSAQGQVSLGSPWPWQESNIIPLMFKIHVSASRPATSTSLHHPGHAACEDLECRYSALPNQSQISLAFATCSAVGRSHPSSNLPSIQPQNHAPF